MNNNFNLEKEVDKLILKAAKQLMINEPNYFTTLKVAKASVAETLAENIFERYVE